MRDLCSRGWKIPPQHPTTEDMEVIVSTATSLDGYLDDCKSERLILSCAADWAEVHALRATCDALLIGAETLRRDNPALVIRDAEVRANRLTQGLKADFTKVVITRRGDIDLSARFFTEGGGEKIVMCGPQTPENQRIALEKVATVIAVSEELTAQDIIDALCKLNINTLIVEGGSQILTLFLGAGCVDRLRLAIAPVVVGDPLAPRLIGSGTFTHTLFLETARRVGKTAVLEYTRRTPSTDIDLLCDTIRLAQNAPKSDTAYSVGAIIITADGKHFEGFSRESDPNNHAEEEAILKAKAAAISLRGATIYSSMEPCTHRKSKPLSCTALIIEEGFSRVVYAVAEPSLLAPCDGHKILSCAGIKVCFYTELTAEALLPNQHILRK